MILKTKMIIPTRKISLHKVMLLLCVIVHLHSCYFFSGKSHDREYIGEYKIDTTQLPKDVRMTASNDRIFLKSDGSFIMESPSFGEHCTLKGEWTVGVLDVGSKVEINNFTLIRCLANQEEQKVKHWNYTLDFFRVPGLGFTIDQPPLIDYISKNDNLWLIRVL
jgi:hypothetical protein